MYHVTVKVTTNGRSKLQTMHTQAANIDSAKAIALDFFVVGPNDSGVVVSATKSWPSN